MSDKSAKNIINKTLLPITNDKDEIKEPSNDNCNKKKIEECNKKGKVCNPLKNTCVDKNGKTYIDYLKTLKKQKTPPITNDKDEIKEPSNDNKGKISKETSVFEKKENIKKYKEMLLDDILTDEEITELKFKINEEQKLLKKKDIDISNTPLTKEECFNWFKNEFKNPRTNILIDKDKELYKEIKKQCNAFKETKEKKITVSLPKDELSNEDIKQRIYPKKIENDMIDKDNYNNELYYPNLDDDKFRDKINNMYEFLIHKIKKNKIVNNTKEFDDNTKKLCGEFEKTYYQHFISHYISSRTPYKSLMLYHGVGVGKTCSAITLSENLLLTHSQYDEPKIWVIMPSALRGSFREQVFSLSNFDNYKSLINQCTGDTYVKMTQILKSNDKDKAQFKLKKFINSRYRLFTYDEFAKMIENEYQDKILKDKIIIIDEAHNIRNSAKLEEKRIYSAIIKGISDGINNKLILLTATPMYNEPTDILDLLYLFLINDKREKILESIKPPFQDIFDKDGNIIEKYINIFKILSNNYISYLRGVNPFTFAVKLKPSDSGFEIMNKVIKNDPNNNLIPKSDDNWINKINDEIILSNLSEKQLGMIELKKELNENNVLSTLQPMNIVYENKTGSAGFTTFFNRIDDSGSLKLTYSKKFDNALLPIQEKLGVYSGKFLKIAEIIKKSTGIVIIYSRFVEGGILPLALILEHMGYNRVGEKNILYKPKIIDNAPSYNYKTPPKYCIMTSHSELNNVMGNSSIDKLLPIINNSKNINGELVKVILMTPVASEGLSFYNARELHIVEPWYHFNKAKQIIGRGIRNCRHNDLPIESRNMTVFMHASFNNYENETPDIHAYRISSKKLYQTDIIDGIIRDNAIDCYLMKNVNYFDKKLFNFNIEMITSQNKKINYNYGDNEDIKPLCDIQKNTVIKSGFRRETYNHLVLNVKKLIKHMIINKLNNGENYLKFDEIIKESDIDANIIYQSIVESVFPHNLFDDYILLIHNNGIHIIEKTTNKEAKLNIVNDKELIVKTEINENQDIIPHNLVLKIEESEKYMNVILIYLSFNYELYDKFVKYVIKTPYNKLNNNEKYIANCFFEEGALIHKNEFHKKYSDDIIYIGYFNIYHDNIDINLYNFENNTFKSLSDLDKDYLYIIEKRKQIEVPDMQKEKISVGLIVPKKIKTDYCNTFKILSAGKAYGKKTGIVCDSLLKPDQDIVLQEYTIEILTTKKKITKDKKCKIIAEKMLKLNKLYIYPYYKPIID
tara:strand:+ start:327 stop:4076 length:3750 start_codon:yes stop_codon:yes gene_type:complete